MEVHNTIKRMEKLQKPSKLYYIGSDTSIQAKTFSTTEQQLAWQFSSCHAG